MSYPLKAIVFDAYGTLFDVHSIGALCNRLYPGHGAALSQLWRTKQLEYTWLRTLMGRYADFSEVTKAALEYACKSLSLDLDEVMAAQLMSAYDDLTLFPDARDALAALTGCKLAVLSNGAPAMLERLIANAKLQSTFSAVISVDTLKTYKPHPGVYQLAPTQLEVGKQEIGFVSSNYWDVAGAKNFGFTVFWINRTGAHADALGVEPDHVLNTLTGLPAYLA